MMRNTHLQNCSDEDEMARAREIAEKVLGLAFDKIIHSGSEANLVGIRSERILFSQRLDSRTYFVQDNEYGITRKAGIFKGPDEEQLAVCHTILQRLDIPLTEMREQGALKEQTRLAQVDRAKGIVNLEEMEEGKSLANISRQIESLPVWSSSMILGLTGEKRIGFMQLHWPMIPDHIVREACRLDYKIKHGWRPPEQQTAKIESVEAGIIHSPAMGFIMDIQPAIRIIYSPLDVRMGQKPVWYLDRHGRPVPIPRQVELPMEPIQRRQMMD